MAAIKCLVVTVAALVILQTVGVLGSGENLSKWRHSRVIRFKSNGDAQTLEFLDFLSTLSSVQTWKINRGNIDVLVGDDVYQDVRIAAANRNIDISYDIPLDSLTNVTTAAPAALHKRLRNGRQVVSDLTHTKYYTLAEINQWLDDVASKCGDRCSLSTLGQTYNNNPLKILRVGANTGCTKEKIFIDCGIHAREWISPATCVYLVSRFLNDYGSDGQITALLDKYEWYFVPVMNPDGYDYTHTNDRMWRKNRAPSGKSRCPGIDLNRNWDVNFGGTGSSSNKCSETYHGSSPFSEPETKVYKDFIMANKPWHAYFTLHSYGQLILYPYGARVIRFTSNHTTQIENLLEFIDSLGNLAETWKILRHLVDVLVDNRKYDLVLHYAEEDEISIKHDIPYSSFLSPTVAISEDVPIPYSYRRTKRAISDIQLDVYHTLEEIYSWLDNVAASCGDLCELSTLGQTVAGKRDLKVLKISSKSSCSKEKIFIDCGIHAREWISPSTCIYIIDQMLNSHGNDTALTNLIDNYEWYFVPVMNPDGYSYTHTHTTTRLWRKNRRDNSNTTCEGVDLNRNWDINFEGVGSGSYQCSETYRGPSAFSEQESFVYQQFILNNRPFKVYLTLHSYGQYILYPLGYVDQLAPNDTELHDAGMAFRKGILDYGGATYDVFQSFQLYPVSGASDDWAYVKAGVPFSYTIELRNTCTFILPANQIIPTGSEILAGLQTFIQHLECNRFIKRPKCGQKTARNTSD